MSLHSRPLRILFVVDGQNPHATGYISLIASSEREIHVATTYPVVEELPGVASISDIPFDFSAKARATQKSSSYAGTNQTGFVGRLKGSALWKMLAWVRDRTAILAVPYQALRLRRLIRHLKPDVVYALRLPYEGYIAGMACLGEKTPLIIGIWGNDFTLYAANSSILASLTRLAMKRANGLRPDCRADLERAITYGFDVNNPAAVLPGNGGIDTEIFHSGATDDDLLTRSRIPLSVPIVVNPRGYRPYIRNDLFWEAIPKVLEVFPDAIFVGCAFAGLLDVEQEVERRGISGNLRLLPPLSRTEMAAILCRATVVVSLGAHDGTPNSVLEAMACGTFPVALDIPSLREIISSGENGLLTGHTSDEVAAAIIRGLESRDLREKAAELNAVATSLLSREVIRDQAIALEEEVIRKFSVSGLESLEALPETKASKSATRA